MEEQCCGGQKAAIAGSDCYQKVYL